MSGATNVISELPREKRVARGFCGNRATCATTATDAIPLDVLPMVRCRTAQQLQAEGPMLVGDILPRALLGMATEARGDGLRQLAADLQDGRTAPARRPWRMTDVPATR